MPQIAIVVPIRFPYHITQRSNYQQMVFEKDEPYTSIFRK